MDGLLHEGDAQVARHVLVFAGVHELLRAREARSTSRRGGQSWRRKMAAADREAVWSLNFGGVNVGAGRREEGKAVEVGGVLVDRRPYVNASRRDEVAAAADMGVFVEIRRVGTLSQVRVVRGVRHETHLPVELRLGNLADRQVHIRVPQLCQRAGPRSTALIMWPSVRRELKAFSLKILSSVKNLR